jgi:hypothetical protein
VKTLTAVLAIVLLAAAAILPLGCARHNKTETYSGYGFSFEYPAGYAVEEKDGEPSSDSAGTLFVRDDHDTQAPRFMLYWASASPGSAWGTDDEDLANDFQDELASYRQIWQEEGYSSIETGVSVEGSCGGHLMLHTYYEFSHPERGRFHGTVGEVYCDSSSRVFYFTTVGPHTGLESDAVDFLLVFTSWFVCH